MSVVCRQYLCYTHTLKKNNPSRMDKPLSQSLSETNGILIRCCNSAKFLAWRSRALCDLAIRRNCGPVQFVVVVAVLPSPRIASSRCIDVGGMHFNPRVGCLSRIWRISERRFNAIKKMHARTRTALWRPWKLMRAATNTHTHTSKPGTLARTRASTAENIIIMSTNTPQQKKCDVLIYDFHKNTNTCLCCALY